MRNSEDITLEGLRFRVAQLPPRRAMRVFNALLQVCAPALSSIAPAAGRLLGGLKWEDLPVSELLDGFAKALPGLDAERQDYFIDNLLASTDWVTDGKAMPVLEVFDEVFLGRIFLAYRLMVFAGRVNFGGFRSALGASGTGRLIPMPSASEMSSTSAGPPSG